MKKCLQNLNAIIEMKHRHIEKLLNFAIFIINIKKKSILR